MTSGHTAKAKTAAGEPETQSEPNQLLSLDLDGATGVEYDVVGATFTLTQPQDGTPYSTIYVGGNGGVFAKWGTFYGLSEKVGAGNADRSGVTVIVADLPGLMLGYADGRVITIDATAAGWGWGRGRMDLTAVLLHELGQVLGLEHHEHGLMREVLAPGERLHLRGHARGKARSGPRRA